METSPSLINHLRAIRSNLRDAVNAAHQLELKLEGPRPNDPRTPEKISVDSVGALLDEIDALSSQISKMLAHQHDVIGEFGENQTVSKRAYA